MGKVMSKLKEFLGVEDISNPEVEEIVSEEKIEEVKIKKSDETFNSVVKAKEKIVNEEIKVNKELLNNDTSSENSDGEEESINYQTIFIDPKSFNDCKKIAKYIKNDKMVTLNLEYLNSETAQRMMDFLMGVMLVKGASFIEISKKVYTAVPGNIKVHYEGKKNLNDKMYSEMSEE